MVLKVLEMTDKQPKISMFVDVSIALGILTHIHEIELRNAVA